jgi:hypothetical protein
MNNGEIYRGDFHKGKAEGPGTILHTDGSVFEGYFKENMKEGPFSFEI